MAEYKCIACGEVKQSNKECMCPICGYMMFKSPYERKGIFISEIRKFIDTIIGQDIDVEKLDFGKLRQDERRFPDYNKIRDHVTHSEKTEIFHERLKNSAEQMKRYFHETFSKSYSAKKDALGMRSEDTAAFLVRVLSELGIESEFGKASFPIITVDYTESADREYTESADELLDRIVMLADKMYKFIRNGNIYGRAYDKDTKPFKFKDKEEIDWHKTIAERIAACDKVIAKKYVVDIFDDGSEQLTSMLKVTWDAVFVLMSAPLRKKEYTYHFSDAADSDSMTTEECDARLSAIFAERFSSVQEIIHAEDFLADKSEDELFELYNKMLDLDIYHYMSGTKGDLVVGNYEQQLENLIGLDSVKTNIRKIKAYALANKDSSELNLHMCFMGNPGTGKTEAARIIAGILHENGLLRTSKVIETDRSGLVAGYVGQTALKTAEKIEEAMGGVLFIDEAYSLVQGGTGGDYGHEAVSTLIKAMEDYRGKFCVILAGYKNPMQEMIATNQGFQSRIQFTIDFPNYNRKELGQIAELMLKNRGYSASDAAKDRMLDITDHTRKDPNFANAREMRNIIEQVIMCQNVRCAGTDDKTLEIVDVNTYIKDSHISLPTSGDGAVKKILTAEDELEALIGLRSVKRMIKKIKAYAKRNKDDPDLNLHMCFCGNPGTGKTEVARILSRILYEAGVLPEAKLTETDSQGLISKYVGDTASKTLAKINDSMGGVLFIDEAYSLTSGEGDTAGYGDEAVAVLLKQMEDKRGQFCVILAGYKTEMDKFIGTNPGLASRVQFTLDFPDYTREELSEIARAFLRKKKYEIEDDALNLLLDIAEYYRSRPNFANARTIRNILEQVIMNQNLRTDEEDSSDTTLILSDVQDYIDDEGVELDNNVRKNRRIGF
ncbi:AAA family ATPase [uncultured Ruminococcus sp.]|uniref:AAA family ATPase n=1 Tax=uncultured Ruminococcus sp. TaxID=165186 RepID=UPI0025CF58CA|nr:AAA family ATPase [uncultured Ruminococcus sp.]